MQSCPEYHGAWHRGVRNQHLLAGETGLPWPLRTQSLRPRQRPQGKAEINTQVSGDGVGAVQPPQEGPREPLGAAASADTAAAPAQNC